jgi:predicted GIY-YIG superfamily endonuclease
VQGGSKAANEAQMVTIYAIECDGKYIYVGATADPEKRMYRRHASNVEKIKWEKECKLVTLEVCQRAKQPLREVHWITALTTEGHQLLNTIRSPVWLPNDRHAGAQVLVRAKNEEQRSDWRLAAELAGLSFADWSRQALDEAAGLTACEAVRLPKETARQLEQLADSQGMARVTVLCDLIQEASR